MRASKLFSGIGLAAMTRHSAGLRSALMAALSLGAAGAAFAQEAEQVIGKPTHGGWSLQIAASELASDLVWLDDMINVIIFAITGLVIVLLITAALLFNRRRHPEPKRFTHNTPLEITWTLVPILTLVVIAAFSLPVLFKQQEIPEGELVIKVTGHQWYWSYNYVDDEVEFDSYLLGHPANVTAEDEEAGVVPYVNSDAMRAKLVAAGYNEDEFLLAVDNPVVVPVDTVVVMQVTSEDVIHSWKMLSMGVMQDAVPGRIAQLWFKPLKEGTFFGQCSELCGKDHAYMPITLKVVSKEAYAEWLAMAQEEFPA